MTMHTIDLMPGLSVVEINGELCLRFSTKTLGGDLPVDDSLPLILRGAILSWIAERRAELAQKEKAMDKPAQWVQHVSDSTDVYKLTGSQYPNLPYWVVLSDHNDPASIELYIPKAKYKPCPPPTRWESAMNSLIISTGGDSLHFALDQAVTLPSGYRWAWVVIPKTRDHEQRNYLTIEREVEG